MTVTTTTKTKVLPEYLGKISTWPTGHRLLVKIKSDVEETKDEYKVGSIVVPKATSSYFKREQRSQQRGVVVAVGINGFSDFSAGQKWFDPGDEIYFARNAGALITDTQSGESFVLMDDSDAIGVNSIIPPGWTKEEYLEKVK